MDAPAARPSADRRSALLRRSASTVGLWAVVALVLASGSSWAVLGVVGLLSLVATLEYYRMLKIGGVQCFPRFGVLLSAAYLAALYAALRGGPGPLTGRIAELDGAAVCVAVTGAVLLQLRYTIRGVEALLAVAANLLGFVYLTVMFNFVARLMFMLPGAGEIPGLWVVLWGVAVTKFTDMGAYIVGTAIGRDKMIPHVSPRKTWQGFGGALVFAQVAGCGLYLLMPGHLSLLGGWTNVVVLGVLLALLAVVGDLAGSVVKRSLGVKDSGGLLPGIGGAFDLIDSVCFTAPFLYFFLRWTNP